MHEYSNVRDIKRYIAGLDTSRWNFKNIVDMSEHGSILKVHGGKSIHMPELELPTTKNYFNHYNYNKIAHDGLSRSIKYIDPLFTMKPYEDMFTEETKDNDITRILTDKSSA